MQPDKRKACDCRLQPQADYGAGGRNRTDDLFITSEPLCRLSYASNTHTDGADDGTRTRGPQLGKLMLYQLSYIRTRKKLRDKR